ncbi:arabinose efflux permease family protein [Burkholderiales bacterium JOSHI_001]|nr:arabinose efflux permease family protein [Burkholderiales bacterium JOSHI_001]
MSEPGPASAARPAGLLGAFEPLREPVFRWLWLAWLAANICMGMHDVAAAWLMVSLTHEPLWVALVQTASTLPMFLLGLPSGALADIVDRRRYFAATQLWAALIALVLVAVSLSGHITATGLLLLTFLNGITMAMRWPTFSAIVPSIVSRERLPAALALNGLAMNLPRIVGPAIAGGLLAAAGPQLVFGLNAVLSLVAFWLIVRWRAQQPQRALPGERFVGAMRVGLQHVRQNPRVKAGLLRIALLMLQMSSLMALLPLVAKAWPGAGAGSFTALLAAAGGGGVLMVLLMPGLRARFDRDAFVRAGTLAHAASAVVVALAPNVWVAFPAMVVAGAAVLASANSTAVSVQLALPDWVRARGMSVYQMSLMGGAAGGAAFWGQFAGMYSVRTAILAGAAFGVVVTLFTRHVSVAGGGLDEHRPAPPAGVVPEPAEPVDPDAGPVMVTVEYRIAPAQAGEFAEVMRETRAARLRQGALSWGLFRDAAVPGRYVEYFVDETWVEHLRRLERFTAGDQALRQRRLALHQGPEPPLVRRYVSEPMDQP